MYPQGCARRGKRGTRAKSECGVGAREEAPSSAVTRAGNHTWVREQRVTEGAFVLVWGQERQVRLERKKGRNRKLQKPGLGGWLW